MPATKKILVSVHGRRLGISPAGELILDGKAIAMANDAGIIISTAPLGGVPKSTTTTLLASDLFSGRVVGTHTAGANQVYTLPTATDMLAYINANADLSTMVVGASFEWQLINASLAAIDTISVAANTGHGLNPASALLVPSLNATTGGSNGTNMSTWRTARTTMTTFTTFRVS